MKTILSIENSLKWSWSFGLQALSEKTDYKFIRMLGIPGVHIADDLINYFDLTLLQNLDRIKLITFDLRKKVISRIGGFFVDEKNSDRRYDKELRSVGAVIATNPALYEIAKRCNKNAFLIPNGIDLEKFKPSVKRPDRPFTIGFAGNIWGQGLGYKGWKYYEQAALMMFGEIEHKEVLFKHSQIPHDQMAKEFYHKIDCLILPSMGEGCSSVTMEALACGVPVLTTKVGYHGEMLTNGVHCLFIKRDTDDIIEKIKILKRDTDLCKHISAESRKFAETHHDINEIAKQYDEIFKLIIRRA